jgi:hypothetical protein
MFQRAPSCLSLDAFADLPSDTRIIDLGRRLRWR